MTDLLENAAPPQDTAQTDPTKVSILYGMVQSGIGLHGASIYEIQSKRISNIIDIDDVRIDEEPEVAGQRLLESTRRDFLAINTVVRDFAREELKQALVQLDREFKDIVAVTVQGTKQLMKALAAMNSQAPSKAVEEAAQAPVEGETASAVEILERVYSELERHGNEPAVRFIVKTFKRLIRDEMFDVCDKLYQEVVPDRLPPEVMFAFYSMSNLVKHRMPSRLASIERAKDSIRSSHPEGYAEELFDGID